MAEFRVAGTIESSSCSVYVRAGAGPSSLYYRSHDTEGAPYYVP